MGKAARQKRARQSTKRSWHVRSGAEVWAKFGRRHAAAVRAMEASHRERGSPSWDEGRAEQIADGNLTIHEDGSETHKLTPETAAFLKLKAEMFRFKFGRPMGPRDPLFFDVDADTPRPERVDADEMIAELRAAAQKVGVEPDRAVEHFLGREELTDYRRRRH